MSKIKGRQSRNRSGGPGATETLELLTRWGKIFLDELKLRDPRFLKEPTLQIGSGLVFVENERVEDRIQANMIKHR